MYDNCIKNKIASFPSLSRGNGEKYIFPGLSLHPLSKDTETNLVLSPWVCCSGSLSYMFTNTSMLCFVAVTTCMCNVYCGLRSH